MSKAFMGTRLRTLREQRSISQAALAKLLELSPSYLNQIENDQRPLTVAVLLRLQARFGADLQFFSEDNEARLISELKEIVGTFDSEAPVAYAELQTMARQTPALAQAFIRIHRRGQLAEERVMLLAEGMDGDRNPMLTGQPLQPYEEVRDFFYERHNHMALLDERAEALVDGLQRKTHTGRHTLAAGVVGEFSTGSDLVALLENYLLHQHGVQTVYTSSGRSEEDTVRMFDPVTRSLRLSADIEPGQQAFQLGTQIARLDAGELIDSFAEDRSFGSEEARTLARIGFANYYAGALVLPYRAFLAEAQTLRYDIDLLSHRFQVSFETVCHRLSTMQRPDAQGIPFFFVRVDRAGNISKRQSATDFHFSRTGGTCPLWNVYEAFSQPGRVLTQIARMPDGRSYIWIARSISRHRGGFGAPERTFAVALGCDVRYAEQLVYSAGLDLSRPDLATPIGAGCKVCERENCAQRAFPMVGRSLRVEENHRKFAPYAVVDRP